MTAVPEYHPDRFSISADYELDGSCRTITIYFNDDRITIEDIAAAIRVAFNPRTLPDNHFQIPTDVNQISGQNWFGQG